jgi:hypothetical protein
VTAEPPFQALGDVLSLRTQTVSIEVGGKTESSVWPCSPRSRRSIRSWR